MKRPSSVAPASTLGGLQLCSPHPAFQTAIDKSCSSFPQALGWRCPGASGWRIPAGEGGELTEVQAEKVALWL